MKITKKLAATLVAASLFATTSVAAETSNYRPPVDAPAHDRYAATAYCVTDSFPQGMPYTAVMRNDEDAIDAALMRIEDLGAHCDSITVDVVYLP